MRLGFGLGVTAASVLALLPPVTGAVLPSAALNDIALVRSSTYGNQHVVVNGGVSLPAGDWVMHIAARILSNAFEVPLISIAQSDTPAQGYLSNAPNLQLAYIPAGSSRSSDPARGAFILTGRDNAGNWLSPQFNRAIANYWEGWGSNVRYLSGPYWASPDGNMAHSIFIQKKGGRIELWIVNRYSTALLADFAATSFGELTGSNALLGRILGQGHRAASFAMQRFFSAAGSLTPAQMEAIAQGVDPRQYLAFDQPTDILTAIKALGTAVQPHLVGSGSCQLTASGTADYTAAATPPIPTVIDAEMPRLAVEKDQVFQRTGVSSDLTLSGRLTGLDDDIYVQLVDFTTKSTVVKPFTLLGRSVNGVVRGTLTGVPSALQWYDIQLRKGLNGPVYTMGKRFGVGIVLDWWGQSIAEKMRSSTQTTISGTSAASGFLSFFSRAKSDNGSTQGTQNRGWKQTNTQGYGEVHTARLIAEAAQCPVGGIMSAMEGSGIDAWQRGATSAYIPASDTWQRTRPGYMVWSQGQGSTGAGGAAYTVFLNTFLQQTREDFPWNWKLIMEPLNANGAIANNAGAFYDLRKAQSDWADANAGPRLSNAGNFNDAVMSDTVHPSQNAAGQGRIAERIARQVLWMEGVAATSARGPRFTAAARSGAVIDLTVTHNGGAALRTPYSGDITGFRVSTAANMGTLLTIASAVILNANTVRLTLSADPGAAVYVDYQWGNPGAATTPLDANGFIPAMSNPVYDDRSPGMNTALGFPVQFTTAAITATAAVDTTAPTITSASTGTTPEGQAYSVDLTANEPVSWSLRTGDDTAFFTLSGAILSLAARDFETPQDGGANNTYIARLRATDTAGNVTDFAHTVTVTDVVEATLNQLTLASPSYRNTMTSGDIVSALGGVTAGSTLEIVSDTGTVDVQGTNIVVGANRAPNAYDTVTYGASPPTVETTAASETGPFSVVETKGAQTRRTDFPSITVTGKFFPVAGQGKNAYLRTPWTSGDSSTQFETTTQDQVIIIGYFRPDDPTTSTAPLFGARGPNGTEVAPALRMGNDGLLTMRAVISTNILTFGKVDLGKWTSAAGQMCMPSGGEFNTLEKRSRGVVDGETVFGGSLGTNLIPAAHFTAVETAAGLQSTSGVKQTHMFYWMWYGAASDCPPINWADPRNQKAILPDNMNADTGVITLYSDAGNPVTLTPKLFYHGKAQDYEGAGLTNRGTAAVTGPLAKYLPAGHYHPSTTESAFVVVGDPTVVSQSRFSQDGTSMDFGSTAKEGGQFWNGDWWIDNATGSQFTTLPLTEQRARNVDDGTARPLEWINGAMKNPGNDVDVQAYPVPAIPPAAGLEGRAGTGDGSRQGFDECSLDVPTYRHELNAALGSRTDTSGTFVKMASRPVAPRTGQYMAQGLAAYTLARPPLTAGEKYFRPPVSSRVKNLWIRAEDANLDISMFPNLSPTGITVSPFFPTYFALNRLHQVWNLNKRNAYNECAASHEVSYGRNYATAVAKAVLLLCLSSTTTAQKYELARCLTQIGIDYTGAYEEGRVMSALGLGATSIGRKLTLAVAAIVTGNARILAASQATDWMAEHYQIATITQERINSANYPQSMLGLHDWSGERKSEAGSMFPHWVKSAEITHNWYRHVWMQGMFGHYVVSRLVPQLATAMNWPAFAEYAERYYRVEMGLIPLPYEGTTYAAGSCPGDYANSIKSADVIGFWQMRQQFPSYFPA